MFTELIKEVQTINITVRASIYDIHTLKMCIVLNIFRCWYSISPFFDFFYSASGSWVLLPFVKKADYSFTTTYNKVELYSIYIVITTYFNTCLHDSDLSFQDSETHVQM
jgi:hypothetical protein